MGYSGSEEDRECAICLKDIEGEGDKQGIALSCMHKYHIICVDAWIAVQMRDEKDP